MRLKVKIAKLIVNRLMLSRSKGIVFVLMIFLADLVLASSWTEPTTGIRWLYTTYGNYSWIGIGEFPTAAIPQSFAGDITIPSQIEGHEVIGISSWAFYGCTNLTSVLVPECVAQIGDGAFESCERMTNVVLSSRIGRMGVAAFEDCKQLIDVKIPSCVNDISDSLFKGCSSLTNIAIFRRRNQYSEQCI